MTEGRERPIGDRCFKTLNCHTKQINTIRYLPNSSVLISAGADERLCLINTENTEDFETVTSFKKKFGNIQDMVSMASNGYELDETKLITASTDK